MKYIYVGHNKDVVKHNGIVAIGYEVQNEKTVNYTFAFCAKEDRFSKDIAHKIINGRYSKSYFELDTPSIKYEDIKKYIIASFVYYYNDVFKECKFIPEWAVEIMENEYNG